MALTKKDIREELEEGLQQFEDIPTRMLPSLYDYLLEGIQPGHFLSSVFENNLSMAVITADRENRDAIWSWVMLVYNYTPSQCNGSRKAVEMWMESCDARAVS